MATELRPDVVVMDIAMPLLNGLESTRQILKARPEIKVLILSAHSDSEYIERMIKVGASGFLVKQTSGNVLAKAIREVHLGRGYFTPSVALYLKQHHLKQGKGLKKGSSAQMTSREAEMLQLIAEGQGNKGIAFELGISVKTVEKHRQTLMEKLNIRHRRPHPFRHCHGHHREQHPINDRQTSGTKKQVRPMKAEVLRSFA